MSTKQRTFESRIHGVRGDGSNHPWQPAYSKAFTPNWFQALPTEAQARLDDGECLRVSRYAGLLTEEIRIEASRLADDQARLGAELEQATVNIRCELYKSE